MSEHLQKEIEKLKKRVLSLGALAEEAVQVAVEAVEKRDRTLAQQVIDTDTAIDEQEVDLEEECLKVLALHQPVAIDIRFIVAVLKINNDLERIGDLAVNMAERALLLSAAESPDIPLDFDTMAKKAQAMLRNCLDALVNRDADLAHKVIVADDAVDAMNREMYDLVKDRLRSHPDDITPLLHLLSASRHLERIADHATNIAEDIIYMVKGDIVRHHAEEV